MNLKSFFKALAKAFQWVKKEAEKAEEKTETSAFRPIWAFGGVDGSKAVECDDVILSDLLVQPDHLFYSYAPGSAGCEALGAESRTDHTQTLACLFVKDSAGQWIGGKFDWVSTSRLMRDFKNIKDGYKGWPTKAVDSSTEFAFCILSRDGALRSNYVFYTKG